METVMEEVQNVEPKKKAYEKNKKKNYVDERNEVLLRLYNILGVTDTNREFSSDYIEESEERTNAIYELEPDIIKYFNVSTWSSFKKDIVISRRALSIVKSLLKDMNVNYDALNVRKMQKGEVKHITIYKLSDK